MYREVGFKSRGDHGISQHVVTLLSEAGLRARLLGQDEPRGQDGRGFAGTGLDHGVFVPLSIMFPGHGPYDSHPFDIPVIQATIDGSMSIEANEALGKAVSTLRSEGVLILSGGLTVHTFEDLKAFREDHAPQEYKDWDQAITDAVNVPASASLKHQALQDLLQHPGCRLAHPRLEHCGSIGNLGMSLLNWMLSLVFGQQLSRSMWRLALAMQTAPKLT